MATIVPTDASTRGNAAQDVKDGSRIWCGNLPFSSKEEELQQLFSDYPVTEVKLPKRFGRSQGYAFVTFEQGTDLDSVVEKLNGMEISGRALRLQKATSEGPFESGTGIVPEKSKQRRIRKKSTGKDEETLPTLRTGASDDEPVAATGAEPEKKTAKQNGLRKKGPPEDGVLSKTTIYVANIPFTYSDGDLLELFASVSPVSARIVPRYIPGHIVRKLDKEGVPRKGRGFGFVTFADSTAQAKAVEAFNGKDVDGRPLAVKVAVDRPEGEVVAPETKDTTTTTTTS